MKIHLRTLLTSTQWMIKYALTTVLVWTVIAWNICARESIIWHLSHSKKFRCTNYLAMLLFPGRCVKSQSHQKRRDLRKQKQQSVGEKKFIGKQLKSKLCVPFHKRDFFTYDLLHCFKPIYLFSCVYSSFASNKQFKQSVNQLCL